MVGGPWWSMVHAVIGGPCGCKSVVHVCTSTKIRQINGLLTLNAFCELQGNLPNALSALLKLTEEDAMPATF